MRESLLSGIHFYTLNQSDATTQIYQTLLQYKYLVRPEQLEPLLLAEMPVISEDGLTWRFKLKPGIMFHDDVCFPGGTGRELVARDVFYSWKRLADPEYRYKNFWLFKGSIVGFDEYKDVQAARVDAGEAFDYDAPVEGFRIINDFEFEVTLTRAVRQFAWKLAMFQTAILPREAVEFHGDGEPCSFSVESAWKGDHRDLPFSWLR